MTSLNKLKQASALARVTILSFIVVFLAVASYGYFVEGVWWVSVGGYQFDRLWNAYPDAHMQLSLVIAPIVLILIVGVYFVQRILLEMKRGLFFSKKSMFCLKCVAWLTFLGVIYGTLWPIIAAVYVDEPLDINLRPLSFIVAACLPVLVHLFSAAQALEQENKEII